MLYSEMFKNQWNNVIKGVKKLKLDKLEFTKVSDWYKTESFKWESIVTTEGMLLSQQEPQLKTELVNALNAFRFKKVETNIKKPGWMMYICIALICAIALAVGICFLNFHILMKILAVVFEVSFVLALGVLAYGSKVEKYNNKVREHLVKEYTKQLESYASTLVGICKKYEN